MTYTVTWKFTATQQLERLIAAAADPRSVRQAAEFIDYALRRDPRNMGESRAGEARTF